MENINCGVNHNGQSCSGYPHKENNQSQFPHNVPCGNLGCSICLTSSSNTYFPYQNYWPYYQQICPSCGRCPTCGNVTLQPNQWTITSGGTQTFGNIS